MNISAEGEFLGYLDFEQRVLNALMFETIAEYGYYLAGEVAEEDLVGFQRTAATLELMYEIRRDFDLIQINGYTFSSFGEPTGLPPSLTIAEYDGDIGMYLVQFKAPMTTTWWRALQAAGEVVAYYPQNTYLVRAEKADMPVLRLVNGVQHVSLYQPAYKVRRSLLTRDEEVEVDIEFDGGQDWTSIRTLIQNLIGEDVDPGRIGRFGYARLRAALANRTAVLRRPEVTWVEPAMGITFSGERDATVIAGNIGGGTPPTRPYKLGGSRGYQSWLQDKGFCLPEIDEDGNCMAYWPKVGVFDSGLDLMLCNEAGYNLTTEDGLCTDVFDVHRQYDLNHDANHLDNCNQGLQQGLTLDPKADCAESVITGEYFCSGLNTAKHCQQTSGRFNFSDLDFGYFGHGSAVASIISGNPWSYYPGDGTLGSEDAYDPTDPADYSGLADSHDFYRGIGIAPSARLIVAKIGFVAEHYTETDKLTPTLYQDLVEDVANRGARFANNSWNLKGEYTHPVFGTTDQYEYTLFSKAADTVVRDADGWGGQLKEMTLVFSAGNWVDSVSTDPETYVKSPANAKNVITVGAAQGWASSSNSPIPNEDDPGFDPGECFFADSGGFTISDVAGLSPYGDPIPPSAHSCRGFSGEYSSSPPRYKPDLVAPGTHVASGRSHSPSTINKVYQCFEGTSAATPMVTGSAVLAETWFFHIIGDPPRTTKPSPAMIKAMLVAHADDLAGGVDHLTGDALGHAPTIPQGWGRVNLAGLFDDSTSAPDVVVFDQDHDAYTTPRLADYRRFTESGQTWRIKMKVDDTTSDFVAVMVYTDRFADPGAVTLNVNELDLNIAKLAVGPPGNNGHSYWGNFFNETTGKSINVAQTMLLPRAPWDSHNTVEMVKFDGNTFNGGWFWVTVKARDISAKAIPEMTTDGVIETKNQDFALFVLNGKLVIEQ